MKPHKLTISGFLSYGGCEVIDFDTLASSGGLFLIHGSTGAGKTSILDALAFALYGTLPGSRKAAAKTYRSDFARNDTLTFVELEVTLRGERYSIYRAPAYEKPKDRGEGTTLRKAELKINTWSGNEWVAFSSTTQEGGEALTELIGLKPEEFFKLILLPQGDFAQFLRSSGKEREEILRKLFSDEVDKFDYLTNFFWENLNAAKVEQESSEVAVSKELVRIDQAFSTLYLDGERDLSIDIPTSAELAESYLEELAEVIKQSAIDEEKAKAEKESALVREQELTEKFNNSEKVRNAAEQLESANRNLLSWRTENYEEIPHEVDSDEVVERILMRIEAYQAQKTEAMTKNEHINDLNEQRRAVTSAASDVELSSSLIQQFEQNVASVDVEIKSLEESTGGEQNPELDRLTNSNAIESLSKKIDRVIARKNVIEDIATREIELSKLTEERDSANEKYLAAQEAFDSAQASLLAQKLEDGSACPVCGSTAHPNPATSHSSISKEAVERARELLQGASTKVARKEAELLNQKEKEVELTDGETLELHELELQRENLQTKDLEFEKAMEQLQQSRRRLSDLKKGAAQRAEEREALTSKNAAATAKLSEAQESVKRSEKKLELEAGGEITLINLKPIEGQIARLRTLKDSYQPLLDAAKAARNAFEALSTSGVDEVPDPNAAKLAREHAEEVLKATSERHARLNSLKNDLSKIGKDLRAAEKRVKQATEDCERYEQLAKYLKGQVGERITLVSYFLGQRLHQILERANLRLQSMTRGQYSLQPNHEKRGAGQNYLSISVFDSWNQGLRDANTLSGGETFTTSLALAFGLADVVTSETGGQSLDSLFIDEGFGSLDPDYLQSVMQSLEELRESGRIVGLISHVEEMKQRISMQLLVTKENLLGTHVKIVENVGL
jgi:DNA repair protein SbcC/Rad50